MVLILQLKKKSRLSVQGKSNIQALAAWKRRASCLSKTESKGMENYILNKQSPRGKRNNSLMFKAALITQSVGDDNEGHCMWAKAQAHQEEHMGDIVPLSSWAGNLVQQKLWQEGNRKQYEGGGDHRGKKDNNTKDIWKSRGRIIEKSCFYMLT